MRAIAKFIHPQIFEYVTTLENYNEQLTKESSDLTGEKISLEAENRRLKEELALLQQLIQAKDQHIDELIVENNAHVDRINEANREYDELVQQFDELKNQGAEDIRSQYDAVMEETTSPWAIFEVLGFEEQGVKINFNWNRSFISEINKLGFTGEDDEETVQQFFAVMKMLPSSMVDSVDNDIS
jgi:uncharacterized coiled-coil DUF342 family protein